jgi:hypothetical protein
MDYQNVIAAFVSYNVVPNKLNPESPEVIDFCYATALAFRKKVAEVAHDLSECTVVAYLMKLEVV